MSRNELLLRLGNITDALPGCFVHRLIQGTDIRNEVRKHVYMPLGILNIGSGVRELVDALGKLHDFDVPGFGLPIILEQIPISNTYAWAAAR